MYLEFSCANSAPEPQYFDTAPCSVHVYYLQSLYCSYNEKDGTSVSTGRKNGEIPPMGAKKG
jgi:hypothetical protein